MFLILLLLFVIVHLRRTKMLRRRFVPFSVLMSRLARLQGKRRRSAETVPVHWPFFYHSNFSSTVVFVCYLFEIFICSVRRLNRLKPSLRIDTVPIYSFFFYSECVHRSRFFLFLLITTYPTLTFRVYNDYCYLFF